MVLGWVGGGRIWAIDGSEFVTVTSGIIGGVYGAVDAVLNGNDVIRGASDGVAVGGVVPGMVVGIISGVAIGGVVQCVTLQPMTEASWVGWGSAGAVIGGVASHAVATGIVGRQLNRSAGLPPESVVGPATMGTLRLVYLGSAATDAVKLGKYASDHFETDVQMHQYVCRTIRREKDPGTALLVGFSKEASDYFLSTGHTEYRDLQNDWEGVFSGGNRY